MSSINWEIVASTGEWAGAIAVVASLLYLARQIKLTNQQSRAAARYSFLETYGRANAAAAQSAQASGVFRKGLDAAEMSDDEHMQFVLLLGQFLNTWSVMFDLHQEGELPGNQWELVETDIHAALVTPGGKRFWDELGRINTHAAFVEYVDKLLAGNLSSYAITPAAAQQRRDDQHG